MSRPARREVGDRSTYDERMAAAPLTDAKRRIVDHLKRLGPSTAAAIAAGFGLTDAAVRQHLGALAANGLVAQSVPSPQGRGRPAGVWTLTPLASDLFPDRHGGLTLELLRSIREAFGDDGLDQVIAARTRAQKAAYEKIVATLPSWQDRARALADRRSDEGYMAEVVEDDQELLLIENHCPICDAASSCSKLCQAELDLFRSTLGDGVSVAREEHLVTGDHRCAYRITRNSDRRAATSQ